LLKKQNRKSSASVKNKMWNRLFILYCDCVLTVKPFGKYTTFHVDCPAAIGLLLILSPKLEVLINSLCFSIFEKNEFACQNFPKRKTQRTKHTMVGNNLHVFTLPTFHMNVVLSPSATTSEMVFHGLLLNAAMMPHAPYQQP
jgi:hypothetical protein